MKSMSESSFDINDVERILKSIFPQVGENPLGDILREIIQVQEDLNSFMDGYADDQKHMSSELEDIKARTFGILILQIIKIIKTLMGLLPAGRFILLAIAALGLVGTFMETGGVSSSDIRDAVERSGLQKFLDESIARLRALAEQQAQRVEGIIAMGAPVIQSAANQSDYILVQIEMIMSNFNPATMPYTWVPEDAVKIIREQLNQLYGNASGLSNLTANIDSLILGSLEQVPQQIRAVAEEATNLVK